MVARFCGLTVAGWSITKTPYATESKTNTGFVRIRHYGLLANRCRSERLECCRKLLSVEKTVLVIHVTQGGLSLKALTGEFPLAFRRNLIDASWTARILLDLVG